MKIAFLDIGELDYTIETVYQRPMGGSSSSVCYLAEILAERGQEVFLLNKISTAQWSRGVFCLPFHLVTPELRQSLDILIIVNIAQGLQIRPMLAAHTRLILWTGHAADQPSMQALADPAEQAVYDGFAFVSEWQRQQYCVQFGMALERTCVLRNAISPAFCDRLPTDQMVLQQKARPPILAYTSTPFRGLEMLLNVFPAIRQAVPGTVLNVYSSMQVYGLPDEAFEDLYHQCQTTEGVQYIGSLPQPELARQLQTVTALTYPNTFTETACIAIMEAMASGCWIITSELGALPETTAGFARLIPVTGDWEVYQQQFIAATIQVLKQSLGEEQAVVEQHLRQQVTYTNQTYHWQNRAQEWLDWLITL